ncbi:hypothetical protein BHE74_00007415 [Ensete ventricosum]|nr:hypothetical protein GW17_00021192 [Ensete ventricosum]RWW84029.1 hypothetical protein BHE74_00007415 [Ensete ventricosum]
MGVLRSTESLEAEIEEMLLRRGGIGRTQVRKAGSGSVRRRAEGDGRVDDGRTVCVTGGISFVGFAVVNHLLDLGYTVRFALETQGSLLSLSHPSLSLSHTLPPDLSIATGVHRDFLGAADLTARLLDCRGHGQAEGDGDVRRGGQGRGVGGDGQRDGLGGLVPGVRWVRRGVPHLQRRRSGGSLWLLGELDLYLDVLISFVSVPNWESEAFVFVFIGSSSVAFFACETNLCCAPPPVSLTEAHGPNGGESSRAGGRSLRENPIGQKMRLHLLASGLRLAREQHSSK